MKFPELKLSHNTHQILRTIPKAVASMAVAGAGVCMGRQCVSFAQNCTIKGLELSKQILEQKALESSNKLALRAISIFSECGIQYQNIGAFAIATFACGVIAYKLGKEVVVDFPKSWQYRFAKKFDSEPARTQEPVAENGHADDDSGEDLPDTASLPDPVVATVKGQAPNGKK